jgi:hypothetical protein
MAMRKTLGKLVVASVLFLPIGQAWGGQNGQGQNNNDQGQNNQGNTRSAPEISAAALPALAAVLVGFSLLMTHRRKSAGDA